MDIRVTAAELARRWGKSYSAVAGAINAGRIERGPDGLFPLQATLDALKSSAKRPPTRQLGDGITSVRPKQGRPPEGQREAEAEHFVEMAFSDPKAFMRNVSLAEATRVERAAAALARVMAVERSKREWCTVTDVIEVFGEKTRIVRQRLLSVPGSIASLVAPHDPAAAERHIADAINEALTDLSAPEIAAEGQARRDRRQAEKAGQRAKRSEDA